ncbi:MAG: ATP-binding protein [Methanoregula sp.]|nr:ATP-binding protein [Methanoregula sp.]
MKIHTRTLLILGATVFVLIFAMNFFAQFFILSSYAQIEQDDSVTDVQRVVDQIHREQSELAKGVRDWAVWDDSYRFIEDHNEEFRASSIEPASSYESLRINGILYYDSSGVLVAGRWYDLQNKTDAPVPTNVLTFFTNNHYLFQNNVGCDGQNGLILLPEGPMLVSLHPILPSSGAGPGNGTLVMVRSYDRAQVAELGNLSHLPVRLTLIPNQGIIPVADLDQVSSEGISVIVTRPQNAETITGYTLVRDINNEPILLLQVDSPRYVYQQAMATLAFLVISFIMIGIIYVITTELLLRRYIVNPLLGLDASMKKIGRHRDLSERLPVCGDDEIASLKSTLNNMLQELQDKETELARRGELLADANRKANLYLDIYLDVLTYEILNSTLCIRGYAELIGVGGGEKECLYAQRIIDTINRDAEVIRNMETISKIFKNPPAQGPVDLDEVIRNVVKSYPNTNILREGSGIFALADPMLASAFHNIISNSIKFGGSGVKIEIFSHDNGDGTVECSVTDTGPGIPDLQKPGVFDRFMQGSEKRSSYGLGLHIAKMLIEAYGGRIWADDRVPGQPGLGAAIRFTLKKGLGPER